MQAERSGKKKGKFFLATPEVPPIFAASRVVQVMDRTKWKSLFPFLREHVCKCSAIPHHAKPVSRLVDVFSIFSTCARLKIEDWPCFPTQPAHQFNKTENSGTMKKLTVNEAKNYSRSAAMCLRSRRAVPCLSSHTLFHATAGAADWRRELISLFLLFYWLYINHRKSRKYRKHIIVVSSQVLAQLLLLYI